MACAHWTLSITPNKKNLTVMPFSLHFAFVFLKTPKIYFLYPFQQLINLRTDDAYVPCRNTGDPVWPFRDLVLKSTIRDVLWKSSQKCQDETDIKYYLLVRKKTQSETKCDAE